MSDTKQVKVDNWGVYFLQRLKHFFNRTDYCDLTLQFQDNAQLKVHRLVISACTEYFELLERTCEMYEDCLVMPDDLQADVVVPIVNFMYTGQLEFKPDLLERLHQTSQIMNMPVLTKLLDAQRSQLIKQKPTVSYSAKSYKKHDRQQSLVTASPSTSSNKRSYTKAFENIWVAPNKPDMMKIEKHVDTNIYQSPSTTGSVTKKPRWTDPCPTRYELPEDLDTDNVFGEPFKNISYESKPLMVHPETRKQYSSKSSSLISNASSSKLYAQSISTLDIVECKKIVKDENIFDESVSEYMTDDNSLFGSVHIRDSRKESSQLFDKILERNDKPKVTIENKEKSNVDHAKIISEVLKKYPHLVKSNKNIKLKIVNAPATKPIKKHQPTTIKQHTPTKVKNSTPDFTYETDVLNSAEAAKLIAMGAENVAGPWICLICGTPGKALNFTSYYKFRQHLVNVHNEKPVSNICEYCGLKSPKRNYLLHHMYTKHGIDPPPQYHFPKCNSCSYVALTEGFLIKHKLSHTEGGVFRCNVCSSSFKSTALLLQHIQLTGHKYSAERKSNLQCIYCLKVFLRKTNLYTHLKTHHKYEAKSDGVIDDSDEEDKIKHKKIKRETIVSKPDKYDIASNMEIEYEDDEQYQIQERPDGNIEIITKNSRNVTTPKQKILNDGFNPLAPKIKKQNIHTGHSEIYDDSLSSSSNVASNDEEIVMIGDEEYIIKNNELIPRKKVTTEDEEEFIISDIIPPNSQSSTAPSTSVDYTSIDYEETVKYNKSPQKKTVSVNQPIQIVVSNDNEFKAFMPSNHPILFENADTNKTLTVLTAPPNTLGHLDNTTIDLNSAQSNDMMILQDDYPLSVTESVPTGNSNIVVVYSHPVDESKPYTLLSSQEIGTQYTSAVITQNFCTTTNSTPVMRAQIIDPEADSWQTNTQEKDKCNEADEKQLLAVIEKQHLPDTNINNELPEVHLVASQDVNDTENVLIQQNINSENEMNTVPVQDQNTDENIDVNSKNIVETKKDQEIQSSAEDQSNEHCNVEMDPGNENHSTLNAEIVNDCNIVIVQEPDIETNTSMLEAKDNEPDNDNEEANDQEKIENDELVSTNVNEPDNTNTVKSGSKDTIKQIENLTMEWSEEEDEISAANKEDSNEDQADPQSEEIEESIENIQHELEKDQQINGDNDIHDGDVTQNDEPEIQNTTASTIPTEKISSLLNDWEENDSQEGQEAKIDCKENDNLSPKEISDGNGIHNKNDDVTSTVDIKKGDPLRSLVSDWEEEDEDKE